MSSIGPRSSPRFWRAAVLLPLALVVVACSDGTSTPITPHLATVTVAASTNSIEVGESILASATGFDDSGKPIATGVVSWSATDNTVASVTTEGRITGLKAGNTTIRATSGAVQGQFAITVVPATVAEVRITPATSTVTVGGSQLLTVSTRDKQGAELTGRVVTWSSSNVAIASVRPDGTVLGTGAGTATITATSDGKFGTATVTVGVVALPALALQTVATGILASYVTAPPGDTRQFIVGLDGRVWIVKNGAVLAEPFLDLRAKVRGVPLGLYSLAFHPQYATNGYLFVAYTDLDRNGRIERYTRSTDADRADSGSAKAILTIPHPAPFDHYGGWLGFGSDGKLYSTQGDGGAGNSANAQDRSVLLGKILRLDADVAGAYAIPADNPFTGSSSTRNEIWSLGLRNPWRASFDRIAGQLYVGDVGEDSWEELTIIPTGVGGQNFGWNRLEGTHCYPPGTTNCDRTGITLPALEYPIAGSAGEAGSTHPSGCSIIGGFVYRGTRMPALQGQFFYGDFCKGWVRSLRYDGTRVVDSREWFANVGQIVSFGEDASGELYITTIAGTIYRIVPGS